ncbi:sulfotransferase family protein [Rhodanobacter hydrolyticus]|uniref:Sulfotransferase n=1 Tax=Rhodanobacter hydrolyticus TaxID=2250595 RepID=A0ABW8JFR9_9GAMM
MQRIFIVGCPRSGTTLVQAMLARHPTILTMPETAFFEHLYGDLAWRWGDLDAKPQRRRLRQHLGFARKQARGALQPLRDIDPDMFALPEWPLRTGSCVRGFIRSLDARAQAEGRTAWVEKTPSHLLYIPEIERHVPDARFVHVIRPGEDVLASITDASLRYAGFNTMGIGLVPWSRRWNRAAQIHARHAQQPHHHFVFLDDLTRDMHHEWRRLCAFLHIDARAKLGASCNQPIADLRNEPWKHDAVSGLPGKAKRKAEGLFGPQMREWLQQQLVPYEELRHSCAGSEQQAECGVSYLFS